MTVNYTTNLSLGQPVTGTESGTWGDDVNNSVTSYLDIAIAGGLAITITTADVTLTNTQGTSSATNIGSTTAQYAILNLSGAMTAARSLILPSSSKTYIINNSCTGGYALTVKGAATTGVTMRNSESAQVAWNGSDFVKISSGILTGSNVAIGTSTLIRRTTGTDNTVVGNAAMALNNTGSSNVAIGLSTLAANTTGNSNVAIGNNALFLNQVGGNNVAVGTLALRDNTGDFNVAMGTRALSGNTSGASNVGIGDYSGYTNATGILNTAIGYQSLYLGTGNYNISIGPQGAAGGITSGSGNVAIGYYNAAGTDNPAFQITTQNNYISMGSASVTNAYIQVAWTVVSDARDKTDFADVPHGLDFVSKLQPTAYRFKETRDATEGHGPVRYGFKAQDVLALEGDTPVIVDADNPEKLYFNDQSMIAVLVKAIQELKAEFDAYKLTHP